MQLSSIEFKSFFKPWVLKGNIFKFRSFIGVTLCKLEKELSELTVKVFHRIQKHMVWWDFDVKHTILCAGQSIVDKVDEILQKIEEDRREYMLSKILF